MKFKKITRPASEFIILSILAEKDNLHPYEIRNILEKKILKIHQERISGISAIGKMAEKIIEHFESTGDINIESLIKEVDVKYQPLIKFISNELINKIRNDKTILAEVRELSKDSRNILINISAEIKIWETVPAIYQVINDLEKRKLILTVGTETYKGRTRKLYKITPKGKLEALKMLTLFGELTQVITPQLINFQDNINFMFQNHIKIFFRLVENLNFDTSIINSIYKIEKNYPQFQKVLQDVFPFLKNDTLFIALLSNEKKVLESLDLKSLNSNEKKLFRYLLKNRLNEYKEKIDKLIKII